MKSTPIAQDIDEATMRRFWAKIALPDENGCLLWTAATVYGYGSFRHGGRTVRAHRFAFAALIGPVPDGLVLDHLCRNPACVAPDHLEPVTQGTNILRGAAAARKRAKKACLNGHPFDEKNTYVDRRGRRTCCTCKRERNRVYRAARKAGAS